MLRRGFGILLLACLAGAACPAGEADAGRALKNLFAQPDPPKAQNRIDALAAAGDAAKLKAILTADTAYEPVAPGWHKGRTRVADGDKRYDVEFVYRVPRGYDPKRPWPLLLAAHGQHGSGRGIGRSMQRLLGDAADEYVIVAPTMPGPKHFSGRPYQEQTYLRSLDIVCRRLNVDAGRVYVSGYSQGGHVTWHLATMWPRRFAAALPMGGIPWFEGGYITHTMYLENLRHLPLWAIWGEKDTAAAPGAKGNVDFCRAAAARLKELDNESFRGTELPGVGHAGCWPKVGRIHKFFAGRRRKPAPGEFVRHFHAAHHARGYYVEAVRLAREPLDLGKPIRVRVTDADPSQEAGLQALTRHVERAMFRFRVKLDRERNAVDVSGLGVRTLRLYVLDGMFDLSKPVTVRYWSRTWKGKIPRSAACMAAHYAKARDAAALVVNEMDLHITGRAVVRYQ